MTFGDLKIGDTFDWVNPDAIGYNSFFKPCVKISQRKYRAIDDKTLDYEVGTIKAKVYHIGQFKA